MAEGSRRVNATLRRWRSRLGASPLRLHDCPARRAPYLANRRPSGKYLMEYFYYAGGLAAMIEGMRGILDIDVLT